MEQTVRIIILVAALGSGLIAGTFFVFSVAIMSAFGRLSPAEGLRAMQSINLVIVNPAFLGVFLGTALLSAVILVVGLFRLGQPGWAYLITGAAIYLAGSIFVTMVFNVPLNDALEAAQAGTADGEAVWQNYLRNWTYWNHVRTIASLVSSASIILGLASIYK